MADRGSNEYNGLRYAEFVFPMVKTIQEQQSLIEQQHRKLEDLKWQDAELIKKSEVLNGKGTRLTKDGCSCWR